MKTHYFSVLLIMNLSAELKPLALILISKEKADGWVSGGGGAVEGVCLEINELIKQIDGMKPQKKVKSLICRDRMIPPTTCID